MPEYVDVSRGLSGPEEPIVCTKLNSDSISGVTLAPSPKEYLERVEEETQALRAEVSSLRAELVSLRFQVEGAVRAPR